ncbi:MAG: hypothetical protein MN733_07505 [Nitrososphaera sp.]|nr:hypothetical protein [Nitrososphaera sp.]
MATSYTVVTTSESGVAKWLEGVGLMLPSGSERSRYPTPEEIRSVLQKMSNYRVDYFITDRDWHATISEAAEPETSSWAFLVALDYSGNQTVPHKFYFERGSSSVMKEVLNQLAKVCGPLVLINNSDISDAVVATGL